MARLATSEPPKWQRIPNTVYLCHLHNRYLFCSPGCLSILKNSEMESAASGSDSDSVISCHLQLDALLRGTCVVVWTLESLEDNKTMWQQNKHGWGDVISSAITWCINVNTHNACTCIYIYNCKYIHTLYQSTFEHYGWNSCTAIISFNSIYWD